MTLADPGFLRRKTFLQPIIWSICPENCMKMKKNGSGYASSAVPRSATVTGVWRPLRFVNIVAKTKAKAASNPDGLKRTQFNDHIEQRQSSNTDIRFRSV